MFSQFIFPQFRMNTFKGKLMLLCNGYLMIQERKSADGLRQYWRCKDQKDGCTGCAISAVGSSELKETVKHDAHGASPVEVKVIAFKYISSTPFL